MPPSETGDELNLRADFNVIGAHDALFNRNVSVRGAVSVGPDQLRRRLGEIEGLAHQPGVAQWRQRLAKSRSGGAGALSVIILMMGDSRARNAASKYRLAYPDLLRRRFMGSTPSGFGLLPATEGVFNLPGDANWPGGDDPWTYTGAVTGNIDFGLSFHAANIPAAGSATLTYFGDRISLFYVRTAAGPTAATVTLDGVSVGPLNARGTQLPGQAVAYGTNGNFGFHTFTVTPNDGTLIIEGAQWYDNETPFFLVGTVQILDASHSGFGAKDWANVNVDWSAQSTGADAFMGCGVCVLGANDIGAGRTTTQFRDDLVTMVQRIDGRLGTQTLSWLFVWLPGNQIVAPTLPYVQAMREAASIIGGHRAAVFDLAALRPGRLFGTDLSGDESHPSDAGHIWIAEWLGAVLDPTPTTPSPVTPKRFVIDASTPADGRTASWVEAWTPVAPEGYDQSGGGTTLAERRHRVWLDAGTYQPTITMQEDLNLGTVEVLGGRWVSNTPTLSSCGTKPNAAVIPTLVTTRLSTFATDIGGWHPVVIRKTTAAGAVRFVKLVLDKTA